MPAETVNVVIPCAECGMPLALAGEDPATEARCSLCGSLNLVRAFPALLRPSAQSLAAAAFEGEAACFDHPNSRATGVCGQCGRYVCTLCQVEFGAETLCPSCVAAGSGRARAANLEPTRNLWDSMALWLAVLPLTMWPFTFVTAPAALFLSIFRWKAPLSLVRRSRWRFAAAIVISLLQIGGWIVLVGYLVLYLTPGKARLS
jgi:hypothetical protein